MYCTKCGNQLSEGALFCSNCGEKNVSQSPNAGKSVRQDEEMETVLIEGLCNRVKNVMYVQNGKGALTNKRFIYFKHNVAKVLALGILVNLTQGDIDIELPITSIDHIEDGHQGVSKTIRIFTKAGEQYHFYFTKREQWKAAFERVINQMT